MGYSKVIFGGETLIDLTSDTVTAENLLKGFTAHGKDGEKITGTCEFDVDSSDATATAAEVLSGKTVAIKGAMVTGTMKNNGGVSGKITTKAGQYTVPQGYHDGSGKVGIDATEQSKLIGENIRQGVTILGVSGTMSATEGANAQSKTVTPTKEGFSVMPDTGDGYNFLAEVTVAPIPYEEADNSAGGKTVTIA